MPFPWPQIVYMDGVGVCTLAPTCTKKMCYEQGQGVPYTSDRILQKPVEIHTLYTTVGIQIKHWQVTNSYAFVQLSITIQTVWILRDTPYFNMYMILNNSDEGTIRLLSKVHTLTCLWKQSRLSFSLSIGTSMSCTMWWFSYKRLIVSPWVSFSRDTLGGTIHPHKMRNIMLLPNGTMSYNNSIQ